MEKNTLLRTLTKSLLKLHFFVIVPEADKEFMCFRKLSMSADTLGLFACGWVAAMLTSGIQFRETLCCCCQVLVYNGI